MFIKNLLGQLFSYKKEISGIENKGKGNTQNTFQNSHVTQININNVESNIKYLTESLDFTEDEWNSINTISQRKQVLKFIQEGIEGPKKMAEIVSKLARRMITADDENQIEEIIIAAKFLRIATPRQKSIILWLYLGNVIDLDGNDYALQIHLTKIREKFPLNPIDINSYELPFFNRFGIVPDGNVHRMIKNRDIINIKDEPNKCKLFDIFPEFDREQIRKNNSISRSVCDFIPFSSNITNIIAETLLVEIGIDIKK